MGIEFEVIKPQIDESRRDGEALLTYVRRLSREKAEAVADTLDQSPSLIFSADTIGIDDTGELLGKPRDTPDARRMLMTLRDRAHEVITAFTLFRNVSQVRVITRHVRTIVHMRDYRDDEIEAYIRSGDPYDKAGAYAIQNNDFHPVARIEGSYSNVVGLPVDEVKAALDEFGFQLPQSRTREN